MACAILADLYGPEFILQRQVAGLYRREPFRARALAASLCTMTGLIKPLLLPLISTLGLVLMPILAAVKMKEGDVEGTKAYLQAWGVCFLGFSASAVFIALLGFTLPLLWTAAFVATLCALSIICHVAKAMQDPV